MELESQISDMRERLEEEEGTSASLSATKRKLEGELSDLRWDLEGLETTLAKTEKEKQVGRPWSPSPVPSQDRGPAGLALQGHSRSPPAVLPWTQATQPHITILTSFSAVSNVGPASTWPHFQGSVASCGERYCVGGSTRIMHPLWPKVLRNRAADPSG